MSWDDLTFRGKAGFMDVGVRNGLGTIDDIEAAYNDFMNVPASPNTHEDGEIKKFTWDEASPRY